MKRILIALLCLIGIFLLYFGLRIPKILLPSKISINPVTNEDQSIPQEKKIRWGAYTGQSVLDKLDFEERIGSKPDMISVFVYWSEGNYFPVELAEAAASNNQTLVIYWESKEETRWNNNDKKYSCDAILNGEWDNYITQIGRSIGESKAETILIPFVEVNGNWYPWSITNNHNSAEKHKLAYRKIHDMLRDIPNLKMGWVVNNGSTPDTKENSIENLYPGHDYVDYIGVDGFNFGSPWQTFSEVFDETLVELVKLDKPILIFSTASSHGTKKAEWIEDMGSQLLLHPEIKGFIWFNLDKERDWRIWSDPRSLDTFKQMLKTIL